MKLYDMVKGLLEAEPKFRNNDNELIWRVMEIEGAVVDGIITKQGFMNATSTGSIRRARRKVQENFPDLQSSEVVHKQRKAIEKQKGTHIYRETVNTVQIPVFDNETNTVRFVSPGEEK